jgi:transposase
MRENDGRKLDHTTLEVLRLRAVDQVAAGAHPEDVAQTLGLHRKTVYGWVAKVRGGGREALKAKPVPGRPPKLTGEQMRRIYGLVVGSDPRQLKFDFALWTRDLVRELIRREFRVALSAVSVGRLLKTLGLSPQKPLYRAWQADPDAVAAWKATEYPTIAAQAKKAGATVYFVDEASVRSDYHAGTTWAPVGKTPVVASTGARFSVNMISAVTAQGALRFSIITGTLTAAGFIDFCQRLLHDAHGPVFLILDGHPVHRSRAVREFADATDGRLRLFGDPGLFTPAQPRRVGVEERQTRPGGTGRGHRTRPVQGPRRQSAAPAAADAAHRPRVLRRPQPGLHHQDRLSRPNNDRLGNYAALPHAVGLRPSLDPDTSHRRAQPPGRRRSRKNA